MPTPNQAEILKLRKSLAACQVERRILRKHITVNLGADLGVIEEEVKEAVMARNKRAMQKRKPVIQNKTTGKPVKTAPPKTRKPRAKKK